MPKRLLVVDDEAKLLRAVADCLRAEGYDVTTARSGGDALVSVNASPPDLIVSDIRMPGMDGYQLARTLRQNPRTELIPIIFLTAKGEQADRVAGFRSGVDAYITKPFDPDELLAVINSNLARSTRMNAELARLVGGARGQEETAAPAPDADLTDAENRVVLLVAEGLANKEIAAELNLSVRTIEHHISNVLSKKGWSNRVEIARHMLARGAGG